ncbi:leucine-rich repeat-containing protein 24-like [Onthophagus taurus]|uniref:leucine-rich repeat-containing protein 24-like n=1 Tax=Onthophagus taurus TaxID=166361 RepID=UPI0039BDA5BB
MDERNGKKVLMFEILFALIWALDVARACPSMCTCRWKNGKQTVECGERNLVEIPEGMDASTQVLEFTNNRLKSLQKELFFKMNLIHLQKLYISHNHISRIDENAFKGLTNLIELDLSGNLLDVIPTVSFIDCPSLMRLILSFNPISYVKRYSFNHLTSLNTVELSSCQIEDIEENAFEGLPKIEWLKLDHNKIRFITDKRILPKTLRGIELQGNPWFCDCNLLEFHSWIVDFKIPSAEEPLCYKPSKYSGKSVRSLVQNDLACLPEIGPTSFFLEVDEGKNISLLCQIKSIPDAEVSWWFRGRVLQNDSMVTPTTRLIYFIEEGDVTERTSELLIFNTNSEDNGTYICSAENPAGKVQTNFTVKIILKEEPSVEIIIIPFNYLVVVATGAGILILLLFITMIICATKCKNRKLKKNEEMKQKKDQEQTHHEVGIKIDENKEVQNNGQEVLFYAAHSSDDLLLNMSPISMNQVQLEQNPDLINDAERRQGDGEDLHVTTNLHEHPNFVRRKLPTIHSWDVGCSLIDMDGFPLDYGLPKPPPANNCYRTLPYNRAKRQPAGITTSGRFSREAEFLQHTIHPSYEHYCSNVRYTADGYPVRTLEIVASPPEEYKNDDAPNSLPCCVPNNVVGILPWPQYVSANIHKRCVSAQTDGEPGASAIIIPNDQVNDGGVTESPDEGYGDEPTVVI